MNRPLTDDERPRCKVCGKRMTQVLVKHKTGGPVFVCCRTLAAYTDAELAEMRAAKRELGTQRA